MANIVKAAIVVVAFLFVGAITGNALHVSAPKEILNPNTNAYIRRLASFAIQEFNKEHGRNLVLSKVVRAQLQLGAGLFYHLAIEASDGLNPSSIYTASLSAWNDSLQLINFQPSELATVSRAVSHWRVASAKDPLVQEAAQNALKILREISNSLDPYELLQIISAMEREENTLKIVKLKLEMKLQNKVQDYTVVMTKHPDGKWSMKEME